LSKQFEVSHSLLSVQFGTLGPNALDLGDGLLPTGDVAQLRRNTLCLCDADE
jgi:hypothetical protein